MPIGILAVLLAYTVNAAPQPVDTGGRADDIVQESNDYTFVEAGPPRGGDADQITADVQPLQVPQNSVDTNSVDQITNSVDPDQITNSVDPDKDKDAEIYNADTRNVFGAEKQSNGDIISSRRDTEADLRKTVLSLLGQLETHIEDEKQLATGEAGVEHTNNAESKKVADKASAQEQQDAMGILHAAVTDTTAANVIAEAAHAAAETRLGEATAEQSFADQQKASAQSMFETGTSRATSVHDTCIESADLQHDRIVKAVDKQLKADLAYLQQGREVVTEIHELLDKLPEGQGKGTGSRYPIADTNDDTIAADTNDDMTLAQTMSLLSIEQRIKLKDLMNSKYVHEDRQVQNDNGIRNHLNQISNAINTEEKDIRHEASVARTKADTVQTDETLKCETVHTSQMKYWQSIQKAATDRLDTANDNLNQETESATEAKQEFDKTNAAQKAAEDELTSQEPILQAARNKRDAEEQLRFDNESDRIVTKLENAHDYLAGEAITINDIRIVLTGLGSTAAMSGELIQMGHRLVNHFVQMRSKYVSDLAKHSDIKENIEAMLDEAIKKANDDKTAVDTRKVQLDNQNAMLKQGLEDQADGKLKGVETEHQGLVDAAQKLNDNKLTALNTAKTGSANALQAKNNQKGALDASTTERARVLPLLAAKKSEAQKTADDHFARDNGLATSKKEDSLKYLNEEADLVATIREALKGLNRPVGELLEDATLDASRHGLIEQLVTMAGKYDNTKNAGYQGSDHVQKVRIEELLQEVEAKINKEKDNVQSTFDADTQEIQQDKDSAYTAAKTTHDDGVGEQDALVSKEQKEFDRLSGEHSSRVKAQNTAQNEFDTAAGNLTGCLEAQTTAVAAAKKVHQDEYSFAKFSFEKRAKELNLEATNEKKILDDTIDGIGKVKTLLRTMNFAASQLVQYNEDRTSYRQETTKGLAGNVLVLIDDLRDKCDEASERCGKQYIGDSKANTDEKKARDDEAQSIADGQIKDLKDAVGKARKESEAANEVLKKATQAHAEISTTHNAIIDARATAEKIQELNIPLFEDDFKRTKALANDVFDEEREIIDGKAASINFYLGEEMTHLSKVEKMLSHINALSADNQHSIGDNGFSARPDFSLDNNAQNWEDRHSEDYKRERNQGENTDTVEVNAADHELTADRGESQKYDERGEATTLIEIGKQQTVGESLETIQGWVKDEAGLNKDRHAKETEQAKTRSKNLIAHAQKIMDGLKSKDEDRRDAAQQAEDLSLKELETAAATKQTAQDDATAKAAVLADALQTQEKYTPLVQQQLTQSLKETTDAHAQSKTSLLSQKNECVAFLDEEKALLEAVRSKVSEQIGIPNGLEDAKLLQEAVGVLQRIHANSKYEFHVNQAQSYEHKQAGNYMTDGPTEHYTSGISKLSETISKIRAKDEALLTEVKQKYTNELSEFEDEKTSAIAESLKVQDACLTKLQDKVDLTRQERDTAESARADQEKVKIAAESDFTAKDKALNGAKTLEASEVGAAQDNSSDEIAAAKSTFATEKVQYDDLLEHGSALLDKETALIGKITSAMSGEGLSFQDKPKHAKVDYCTAEKDSLDKAANAAQGIGQLCNSFTLKEAGGHLDDATEDEKAACERVSNAEDAKDTAGAEYHACISQPASLMSVHEAKTALVQLGTKYIREDYTYEEQKASINKELNKILATLSSDRQTMADQYKADLGSSTKKRDDEIARSEKVVADLVAKHKGLVAAAQKLRDDASTVQTTEQETYDRLAAVKNEKQALFDAALLEQTNQGKACQNTHQANTDSANSRYTSNAARIVKIKDDDLDYINEELIVVATVEAILKKLNITDEVTTNVQSTEEPNV
jgi:hypothetical protein